MKTRYSGHLYSRLKPKWTHIDLGDRFFYYVGGERPGDVPNNDRGHLFGTLGTFFADMSHLVTLMTTLVSVTGIGSSRLVSWYGFSFTGLNCISRGFNGYLGVTYGCRWSKRQMLCHGGVDTSVGSRVGNLSFEWVNASKELCILFGVVVKLIDMGDKTA